MKKNTLHDKGSTVLMALFLVFFCTSASLAAQHNNDKATASDVKKEAMETYAVLKAYTVEQRDEALAAAEVRIKKLDAQISEMQKTLDAEWQDLSKATQAKRRQALEALRQQRQDLAEWYGGMRHSSGDAWEEVKKGFSDSYERLQRAFTQARKDFNKNKAKER